MDEYKVCSAIGRILLASDMALRYTGAPLHFCISGGKDSSVIQQLAIEARVPAVFVHTLTTVDAPETVHFVRSEFGRLRVLGYAARIDRPPRSMWRLIEDKCGFPPMRMARYCCQLIKERQVLSADGRKAMIVTGVRWSESVRRRSRGAFEALGSSVENNLILAEDNDPARKLFEDCKLKGTRVCNPIVDWSDEDVWTFLLSCGVPYNPLYDRGFKRVGCIGCPMASVREREAQFRAWPGYARAYIRALDRGLAKGRALGKPSNFSSGAEFFDWWLYGEKRKDKS